MHRADGLPYNRGNAVTFDSDPFFIVTFGANSFRSHIVHHSLKPEWNNRIVWYGVAGTPTRSRPPSDGSGAFNRPPTRASPASLPHRIRVVHQPSLKYIIKFSVYDYDSLSSNQLIGTTSIEASQLVAPTEQTNRALPLQLTKQVRGLHARRCTDRRRPP